MCKASRAAAEPVYACKQGPYPQVIYGTVIEELRSVVKQKTAGPFPKPTTRRPSTSMLVCTRSIAAGCIIGS
jgi:hypothetical protein